MLRKTPISLIVAVIAVGAAAVGAGAGPGEAAAAPGAQTVKKAIWGPPSVNGKSLFPAYRDLGVGLYQAEVRWYQVAKQRPADATDPSDPAYLWPSDLEQSVADAAANGMQVSIRIMGTPTWANGGHSARWVPADPQDFADFGIAAAKKYPSVRIWIVWGEPNREANFAPLTPARAKGRLTRAQQAAPHNYARLLDTTYGALKTLNPANLIVGGNTFTSAGASVIHPYQWIRYMTLPNGRRPRMDMYGHNPFGYRKPDLHKPPSAGGRVDFSDLGRFGKALDRYFPGPPLPFFLSEWGVQAGGPRGNPGFNASFKTQAKWIRAAYRIARRWNRIYTLGWVHSLDTDISPSGLLNANGSPKPGYYAFKGS